MGIFDLGGSVPDAGGWQTDVTAGSGDGSISDLLKKARLATTGNVNGNPDMAKAAQSGINTFASSPLMGGGQAGQAKTGAAPAPPPQMGGGAQGFQTAMSNLTRPVTGPQPPFIGVGSGGSAQPTMGPEAARMPKKNSIYASPFTAG